MTVMDEKNQTQRKHLLYLPKGTQEASTDEKHTEKHIKKALDDIADTLPEEKVGYKYKIVP